jgi:arylmalonate decarboxylase
VSAEPIVGLVVPNAEGNVPPEAYQLYPSGVRFISAGLGLRSLSPRGYDAVIDHIADVAKGLAAQGAAAIAVNGTSLTFYRGYAFHEQLKESVHAATGLPVSTMSSGVVDGLRALGVRRVAVGTAYIDEVNNRLRQFLADSGFEVLVLEGLGLEDFGAPGQVTEDDVLALGQRVYTAAPDADGILISCGGLRTLEVTRRLEEACGLPVVSSRPAALWAAVRLVGHSGYSPGYGRLLALGAPAEVARATP